MYKKNQKENGNIKTKNKNEIVTLLKERGENNRKVGEGKRGNINRTEKTAMGKRKNEKRKKR